MVKEDSISLKTVLAYDISRGKGKNKGQGKNAKDFKVIPYQLIHIEPVPIKIGEEEKYGEGSYYIPILMKGKKGKKIYASVINTNNIGLKITSFKITRIEDAKAYKVIIKTKYCDDQSSCFEKSKERMCDNCKDDKIKIAGDERLDIEVEFPFKVMGKNKDGEKNIAEGKICRGYTH